MYTTIAIEDLGKPSVMLTDQDFIRDSGSAASSRGMPGLRVIHVPKSSGSGVMEKTETRIAKVFDDIITMLTEPLTAEEQSPKPMELEKPSRIIFKGDLEDVNRFLYRRGWADGLPVIPPTEKAVDEMLTGTDLDPAHIVAELLPRKGKATVEKIAVNAVMAGALPTHMPVLIAAVQALSEPASRYDSVHDNLGSWPPFWIINGPVRNDIRVNCGVGIFSPGDIANAAIGRAMGLIIRNIGGVRKGIEDAGEIGNPGKYSLVLGEHEEESPWDPLHMERGFEREDSTVTLSFPRMLTDTMASFFIEPKATGAGRILDTMAGAVQAANFTSFVLGPLTAKSLCKDGWTKEKIKEFISTNADLPSGPAPVSTGHSTTHQRPTLDPDGILIVVAGASNSASIHLLPGERIAPSYSPITKKFEPHNFITKKVELPKNWDELVKKYRNIVPVYAKY